MFPRPRIKKSDASAAALVALRAIRDSADVFPPVKSAAAAAATIWEMTQKVKSNKKDCELLARRAARILDHILGSTGDCGSELPAEALESVNEIERIFRDIIAFMVQLEKQRWIQRYSLQDVTKSRIMYLTQRLDEAVVSFGVKVPL
jgi:hypothetical protein